MSFHHVLHPLAFIITAIGPDEDAGAFDGVILELSFVGRTIFPGELAMSTLLALTVLSLVDTLIYPDLLALTMLLVALDVPIESGAIGLEDSALAHGRAHRPLPHVDHALRMDHPAMSMHFAVLEVAVVDGPFGEA